MPVVYTTDDLCEAYLPNFVWFDRIKAACPEFRLIAFAIGAFRGQECLLESPAFWAWWQARMNWVEIAVHASDHQSPPDGDRQNEQRWIHRATDLLRPFLPQKWGYRSPGWQTTNRTVPILQELGCAYIAYESHIRPLDGTRPHPHRLVNTHLYNEPELKRLYHSLTEQPCAT